jgi:hypothetical protein
MRLFYLSAGSRRYVKLLIHRKQQEKHPLYVLHYSGGVPGHRKKSLCRHSNGIGSSIHHVFRMHHRPYPENTISMLISKDILYKSVSFLHDFQFENGNCT